MTLSRPSLVALTSLLLACSDPFTPPAGTLTGTFGGPLFELGFGSRIVQASTICSGAFFKGPVVPDANGDFVLPSTAMLGDFYSSTLLEIRGRIVRDQIMATVVLTGPTGTFTEQRMLTRGSKGDFSGYACAMSQP